ncbi:MAG: hypothetical protein ACOX1J_04595 [Dethiobacteria bacterium]
MPPPVERFYSRIYGDDVPVITSAVITGRVNMRPVGGITFPGRFRFTTNTFDSHGGKSDLTTFPKGQGSGVLKALFNSEPLAF